MARRWHEAEAYSPPFAITACAPTITLLNARHVLGYVIVIILIAVSITDQFITLFTRAIIAKIAPSAMSVVAMPASASLWTCRGRVTDMHMSQTCRSDAAICRLAAVAWPSLAGA